MHSELRRRLHWGIGEPAIKQATSEIRAANRSRQMVLLPAAVANRAYAAVAMAVGARPQANSASAEAVSASK